VARNQLGNETLASCTQLRLGEQISNVRGVLLQCYMGVAKRGHNHDGDLTPLAASMKNIPESAVVENDSTAEDLFTSGAWLSSEQRNTAERKKQMFEDLFVLDLLYLLDKGIDLDGQISRRLSLMGLGGEEEVDSDGKGPYRLLDFHLRRMAWS